MTAQQESPHRTTGQVRAEFAWKKVEALQGQLLNEYRDLVRKVPGMIASSGLGATLAFLISRGMENGEPKQGSAHWCLYSHLEEWLCERAGVYGSRPQDRRESPWLLTQVVSQDSRKYRQATQEALALLVWLKRFAEALAA